MTKRTANIIILAFIILVILGALYFFFFILKDDGPNTTNIPGIEGPTFFPVTTTFEDEESNIGNTNEKTEEEEILNKESFVPRLRQISNVPTSGAIAFNREVKSSDLFIEEDGSEQAKTVEETVFRYIERSTGHLFETTEKSLTQNRLSNVTIPKIQEATFDSTGNSVLLRYLGSDGETIETFIGDLVSATTTDENSREVRITKLEGGYLDQNIDNLTVFERTINYLKETESGSETFQNTFANFTPTKIISLSTSQWLLQRPNKNILTLTSKADSRIPGFMFSFDINTGRLFQLLEDINGLTTLTSPDGKNVLFSQSRGNDINLVVYNIDNKTFKRLAIDTLPEKCVWSKLEKNTVFCGAPNFFTRTNYPESWYQGKVSFDDSLWKIEVATDSYDEILPARSETDEKFDMIKLALSPKEDYLIFINKNDLTLWSFDLLSTN